MRRGARFAILAAMSTIQIIRRPVLRLNAEDDVVIAARPLTAV